MNRETRSMSAATRRLIAVEVFFAGALLLLASGVAAQSTPVQVAHASAAGAGARAASVTQQVDFTCCLYTPNHLVIHAGDTVEWSGAFASHPLVSENALWTTVSAGNSFSHTFQTPGFYRYYCNFHGGPGGVGMSGTVTVVVNQYLPELLQ